MRFALAFLLALTWTGLTTAKPIENRRPKPVASLTLPEAWQISRSKRGLQAYTKDEEVYIWVDFYLPDEISAVFAEHDVYWREQNVEISGRAFENAPDAGKPVKTATLKATYGGKPTVIIYKEYDLNLASGADLMLTYWASTPEADKKYAEEVKSIIESLEVAEF